MRLSYKMQVPDSVIDIHKILKSAGFKLYIVGGAVRDSLLNKEPKDFDLATDAKPDTIINLLSPYKDYDLELTGKSFGVIRVKLPDKTEYEIATFREDIGSGRRPDAVKFSTIEKDVLRRDLTVNALFYDIGSGKIVDLVGGIDDLKNKKIAAVGDPYERFLEDKLRILRAVRFAARLGSKIDKDTKVAITRAGSLSGVSVERIRDEFVKGLKSAKSKSYFVELLKELNLFGEIFPGLNIGSSIPTAQVTSQISSLLLGNNIADIEKVLKSQKYTSREISHISFLVQLSSIDKGSASQIKKKFKRINISDSEITDFLNFTNTITFDTQKILEFLKSPAPISANDLLKKGISGPNIGIEIAKAEQEEFEKIIGSLRECIRMIINNF